MIRVAAWTTILALIGTYGSCTTARSAMIHQSYAPQYHERFDSAAGELFVGNPHDWSGVGRSPRWATMIAPSHFLSSKHYHPSVGSEVWFFEGNDPTGAMERHVVEQGLQIDGSDLWLGKLATPVGANIATYPILKLPETYDYNELPIYTFGLSSQPRQPGHMRLGRNTIDSGTIRATSIGETTGQSFRFDFDTQGGVGADESHMRGGDSGGPSFAIESGSPALVGLHWFTWSGGSGDTFLPDYIDQLQVAMGGEILQVVPYQPGPMGDMDRNGITNADDLAPFLVALTNPDVYARDYGMNGAVYGDVNDSGNLDMDDVQPFVALIEQAHRTAGIRAVPELPSLALFASALVFYLPWSRGSRHHRPSPRTARPFP